jgi:hypothetical protein
MSDKINIICNDDISDLVKKVMSQTNYDEATAKLKLGELGYSVMRVLRDYMGIPDVKTEQIKIKSVNQEVYKQLRHTLDGSMKAYREKNPVNMEQVITNLKESDENEHGKKNKK